MNTRGTKWYWRIWSPLKQLKHTHTSRICAPGLIPMLCAAEPSVTLWTKTPVLLPPMTCSWLSSASPWKDRVWARLVMRTAWGRERTRNGGADTRDTLYRKTRRKEEKKTEKWWKSKKEQENSENMRKKGGGKKQFGSKKNNKKRRGETRG